MSVEYRCGTPDLAGTAKIQERLFLYHRRPSRRCDMLQLTSESLLTITSSREDLIVVGCTLVCLTGMMVARQEAGSSIQAKSRILELAAESIYKDLEEDGYADLRHIYEHEANLMRQKLGAKYKEVPRDQLGSAGMNFWVFMRRRICLNQRASGAHGGLDFHLSCFVRNGRDFRATAYTAQRYSIEVEKQAFKFEDMMHCLMIILLSSSYAWCTACWAKRVTYFNPQRRITPFFALFSITPPHQQFSG